MSNKLKEIRKSMNLNQKEFAEKIGIKQSYYSGIESGKKPINVKVTDALWKMGVSFDWFYEGKGNIFTNPFSNIANSDILGYKSHTDNMDANKSELIERHKEFFSEYFNGMSFLPSNYEYQQIRYYEKLSLKENEKLVQTFLEELEEVYNSNISLSSIIHYYGGPDFMIEKFKELKPFPLYWKEILFEFNSDTHKLDDPKLKEILYILHIKEITRHWTRQIINSIEYMERYKDMIQDHILEKNEGVK
ncbi:helix-turn-helix transcriptional regulator [Bacteroides sp. 51]|uniref:helix-turn-helix domain-containing protein n=1 Tax=Bacteroides sp. 51 TaxID=2302938 RepID=UPI0013D5EB55|nr:helix-turn-helix transcriptional regulator [Bacteroides sp. 51]NDV83086.1 XRE family transcriptional regulator [Bacteroides sp. 51]